jgi:hypothetical protein
MSMSVTQYTLNRSRALHLLAEIKDAVFTAYMRPGTARAGIEKTLLEVLDRGQVLDDLLNKAEKSPTGTAVFYVRGKVIAIRPPFPVAENEVVRSYDPDHLRTMLERDWRLALVLVRLGHYAIGIFKGEKLVDGKAGTGLVHARHHKGGSSSQRFARHREKQMETFFTRVEIHAWEVIEPRLKEIDYVLYGGTRDTLQIMWRQCKFYESLRAKTLDRLLSVREPKRSTLEEAIAQAYTSTIYEIAE